MVCTAYFKLQIHNTDFISGSKRERFLDCKKTVSITCFCEFRCNFVVVVVVGGASFITINFITRRGILWLGALPCLGIDIWELELA